MRLINVFPFGPQPKVRFVFWRPVRLSLTPPLHTVCAHLNPVQLKPRGNNIKHLLYNEFHIITVVLVHLKNQIILMSFGNTFLFILVGGKGIRLFSVFHPNPTLVSKKKTLWSFENQFSNCPHSLSLFLMSTPQRLPMLCLSVTPTPLKEDQERALPISLPL